MVGAGNLIEILFGLPYLTPEIIVCILMILYVTFWGMLATTWVQIIKAILLLFGATLIALLVLNKFNFNFNQFFVAAVNTPKDGATIMAPGGLISDPISAISLGSCVNVWKCWAATYINALLYSFQCFRG